MPGKEHLALNSFHNGLNTKTDARDIADDNLAMANNISVDDVGRITMSGSKLEIATSIVDTTCSTILNDTSVTMTSTSNKVAGMSVSGDGITAGTFISSITNGTTIVLSQNATAAGVGVSLTFGSPVLSTLSDGYNLFRFSSDYASNGATQTETDYLILWDDTLGRLYWLPGTTNWETNTHLDLSSDWGTVQTAQPVFYYADGALRISDANFSNTDNPSMWIGTINRTLFPDGHQGGTCAITGWHKNKQELLTPTVGKVSSAAPVSASDIDANGVYWHLRNLGTEATSLYTFDDSITAYSDATAYDMTEPFAGEVSPDDESWQTAYRGLDGYSDSNYNLFGVAFYKEDDDATEDYEWDMIYANRFNTGNTISLGTGESLYVAVRMPGDDNKKMWDGTHTKSLAGEASISLTVHDGYLTLYRDESGNSQSTVAKWKIDATKFTDTTTPSGEWHILEFPFDSMYEYQSDYATFFPQQIKLELSVSWTRTGEISTNDATNNSAFSGNEANRKNIPGWDFIQLSDLRIGKSDLVGVNTVGKQKFLMSYTYDELNNESLLYNFGATESNELGNVVFENSTSAYKIGISAYVKVPTSGFNNRVSGANLYMENDGIPYRIAQLRYMKGLKGAWESEYPKSDRFLTQFSNAANKTGIIKTDGLPLLESYEAMNGFSPSVDTLSAGYKTATILNRRAYVGNTYQNSEKFGDKMVKSNANSFDVIPSEGKGIDVVTNDGDSIIKLESYADRILQFKKDVMYLINATRDNEYLEDTFYGKGIPHVSSSTKTDKGIAWANENGCYLYDGTKVDDLIEGKILETEWQSHITSDSDIAYLALKRKLIVTGGSTSSDIYEYSFFTKSWTKSTSKLNAIKTNFIIDSDSSIKYVGSDKKLYKWDDSSSTSDGLRFITKDFTFGNPAKRKKCFKFYVTYKCSSASNVKVYYGTNGKNLQTADITQATDTDTTAGSGSDAFGDNPIVLRVVSTSTIEVDDVITDASDNDTVPANSKVTKIIDGTLLKINNDASATEDNEVMTYSTKGREVSTTSQFGGTSTNCYTVDGLVTTGGEWKQAELVPPSSINNVYSVQLHFIADGTVPADFEINDITIVYREKPIK
jgi:hypothetical protein